DARNDRQRKVARRRRHFVKRAIDAVADFEFIFERRKMDVARTVLYRVIENEIDKPDDRRRVRFCFNSSIAIRLSQLQELARFPELLEDVLHARCIRAVILLDQLFDLLWRRNDDLDVFTERETKILSRVEIERIH